MSKTVVILQSNYLPWKGYLDLLHLADEFVLFDEVQYTKRDWRNRNYIMAPNGPVRLTVPVVTKGRYYQRISEVEIADPAWTHEHWTSIRHAYGKAPYFADYGSLLEEAYGHAQGLDRLSAVNRLFLETIAGALGIDTLLTWSDAYPRTAQSPSERLVEICQGAGATRYVSGPAAKSYIDPEHFRAAGIELRYADYGDYPEYPQRGPAFEHGVSVVDLLFNVGPEAPAYMLSFAQPERLLEPPVSAVG